MNQITSLDASRYASCASETNTNTCNINSQQQARPVATDDQLFLFLAEVMLAHLYVD